MDTAFAPPRRRSRLMCLNRKVLGGLVAAGLALFLLAPSSLGRFAPLLVALACPLSMVFMMRTMSGGRCERPGSEGTPAAGMAEAEIVRLRAEVDQLRAEIAGPDSVPSAAPEPDAVRADQPR